jgi:hypothetical protein
MAPETSQTVPEKPRDRVSVEENDVPNERDCDWKREEEVQEFRSSGVQELQELQNLKDASRRTEGVTDGNTPKFCNSCNSCNS